MFDKGKYVVLEYKPLSDDAEARYYTYEFKDKKHIIIKTLMQKHTTNLMSLTTKKRICINRFRKRRNDEKLIGLLMILCMVLLYSCSGPMDSPKHSNNSKPVVVIYGDYKCPYCKKQKIA